MTLQPGSYRNVLFPMASYPEATSSFAIERAVAVAGRLDAHLSAVAFEMGAQLPAGVYTVDGYADGSAISVRGSGTGIGANDNDILAAASWNAVAMDTLTINWDIATSGADRAFGYLAFPGDVPAPWIPQQYRRFSI